MSRNLILLLACLAAVAQVLATDLPVKRTKSGFLIGTEFYTVESTGSRTRAQAVAFCEGKGGELAKMNGKQLWNILLAATPATGGYWIDGIDKSGGERFEASKTCTPRDLVFTGIPATSQDMAPLSCLNFNKGTTVATSKIQAIPCSTVLKGVICSNPMDGCTTTTTTTPVPVVP